MLGARDLSRDLGDFPTPPPLVAAVLERLGPIGEQWPRVLEPTCGRGHFLQGLIDGTSPPREIRGIEIQASHYEAAQAIARNAHPMDVEVVRANLFDLDLRRDLTWREQGPLLVVGNPPWVTNAELGALGSANLPQKSNVKQVRGIDARTGASNFDIAEAIWLKLLKELAGEEATIALLCKTSVARGVLQFAERTDLPITEATIVRLDAKAWFRAAVDACLFRVRLGVGTGAGLGRVPVFAGFPSVRPESALGFVEGRLIADLDRYRPLAFADGQCPLTWRQGLKHDAATVMELEAEPGLGSFRNKLGESLDIEPEWVYPLLKGADLVRGPALRPTRSVIVTQRRVGDDTRGLEQAAPRLWAYLEGHTAIFARRKSSIYRGQAPFAMFGLGPYSFAPYKVAVSGLGKAPRFHAVGSVDGRPIMFDDTCYFLPCRSPEQAAITAALLNDPDTLALIDALIFRESKRPITKSLLTRLDLVALSGHVDCQALLVRAEDELTRLLADESIFRENRR
ncbi:hypothetical protein Sinac_0809 [Singulisphaera acidiphila DSM 18658]|uniref:Uncharacterized protein n=1 Tax=Singulisphaera acidiphila (strain ATCC BAA-1392 / DSM 18658 / VKM B-2454 / MOB10) TaxID=886293 RepID=L0D7J4_SINAD|nr:hypothetical protein Sinac_0809 [Singulisphaera acidiphila DSM 18658]